MASASPGFYDLTPLGKVRQNLIVIRIYGYNIDRSAEYGPIHRVRGLAAL